MNMRDYSSLHLDTINSSKGTVLLLLFYISVTVYMVYPAISTFAVQICYSNKFLLYSY